MEKEKNNENDKKTIDLNDTFKKLGHLPFQKNGYQYVVKSFDGYDETFKVARFQLESTNINDFSNPIWGYTWTQTDTYWMSHSELYELMDKAILPQP